MEVERLEATLAVGGLSAFSSQMEAADRVTAGVRDKLDRLTAASELATKTLQDIRMKADQAAATAGVSEAIKRSLSGISTEAERARADIERVKMDTAQAAETTAAGDVIDRKLKDITGNANEARRSLESVRLAGAGAGGGAGLLGGLGGAGGSPGGGIGLMPAAIGAGALLAPAAAPGAFGLLASIPTVVAGATGALGTLVLAFQGVSKAIGGNKKAFDDLGPSAQQFVLTVRSLDGWFDKLKQTAGAALFPGLTAGLKAALSPGTVAAVTQAIGEFGKAIGDAGAAWGRYFGSAQFQQILGPLMSSGAQNLGKMADAALHLFDALGVLGRAAIPLVNWMSSGADAAARWVDSFTRAKDASGVLSGALDQARQSLQLVGGLFTALVKVVYDLGAALYPVSKVAVKDLTDGLDFLDGVVRRNRQTITDIVGGALASFVSIVKAAYPIVAALAKAANAVASAIGGWKLAFDIIISGLLVGKLMSIADALGGAKGVAGEAATATSRVGTLRASLASLAAKAFIVTVILDMIPKSSAGQQTLDKVGLGFLGHLPIVGGAFTQAGDLGAKVRAALGESPLSGNMSGAQANAFLRGDAANKGASGTVGTNFPSPSGSLATNLSAGKQKLLNLAQQAIGTPYLWGGNGLGGFDCSGLVQWAFANGLNVSIPRTTYGQVAMGQQVAPGAAGVGDVVFTNYGEGGKSGPGHEGLIVGFKNGQPIIEAAPHTGSSVRTYNGYGAFTGGAQFTVRDLLAKAGAQSGASPFGAVPPFTSGLGPKPPKPPVIPATATHLLNLASTNAANASTLSNTGGTAKRYLELELMDLDAAQKQLQSAYDKAHGKAKTQLDTALTSVGNKITSVTALIAKAIVTVGEALLPDKLVDKLNALTKKGQADADYAAALTGQAAVDYQATIRKNLLGQGAVLQQMVAKLKTKIAGDTGKQKTADEAELTKIQGQLDQVQQGVLASLQATVQALQGKVTTAFAAVQADLVQQLGDKYFQNGLQTPSEALLSQMQAADQLNSLTDSLDAAKKQQIQDQNTLSSVVYDMTTGLTTYNYSTAAQQQLDADNKAVLAAQRQLDEYNLSIKAAQERQSADQTYASQLDELNKKLGPLADAFANGTGSISALKEVAKQFGLQISTSNTPDLADLSSASKGLKAAFVDLADYIAKITGATPKIPDVSAPVALLNSQALGDAQSAYVAANPTATAGYSQVPGANVTDIVSAARDAGYTQSVGALRRMGVVPMADGGTGRVTKPTLFLAGEAGSEDYAFSGGGRTMASGGGGVTVNLSVSALDPSSVDWGMVADKVRSEFVRLQRRNGGVTGIK